MILNKLQSSMKNIILIVLMIVIHSRVVAQPTADAKLEKMFVEKTLMALSEYKTVTIEKFNWLEDNKSEKVPAVLEDVSKDFQNNYLYWKRSTGSSQDKMYSEQLTQQIYELSLVKDVKAAIEFRTAKDSAVVMFQTIWSRSNDHGPSQAGNITNKCYESLPFGYYYIWTQRRGQPTSDIKRRFFIDSDKQIFIEEY